MNANRSFLYVVLAAGAVFALSMGLRQSQPLFISALNSHTAAGYAAISLAFGIGQLMWGIAMPVAGGLSDRYGARPVMVSGALMVALGTLLIPLAVGPISLILTIGLLTAIGAGCLGPAQLLAAAGRKIPEAKRSVATGIINAGGSFGQFAVIPLAQLALGVAGWQPALVMLGIAGLAAVPLLAYVTRDAAPPAGAAQPAGPSSLRQALRQAAADRSYWLLSAGFFTCGFHVAFIGTHLPGVVASCQLDPAVAAWSLSLIGLFNIAGSLWIGKFVQSRRMKFALAGLYFARAAVILVFFFAPKTPLTFYVFAAALGFTWLSTVPPTIGLVAKLQGMRYLAMLFGMVMLSHQVGGFLGASLGGKAFELSGNYDWMWFADIALCLFAAVVNLPIREARPRPAAAAA